MTVQESHRRILIICLVSGPLLQLIGDALWLHGNYNYSWNLFREASTMFFVPCGFLFAKMPNQKSPGWAIVSCALFVVGCLGCAGIMPLFRLSTFYHTEGHYALPDIVNSVLGRNLFGATVFLPGLCFPVSLIVFGIAFTRWHVTKKIAGINLIVSGIFFWLGNAGEVGNRPHSWRPLATFYILPNRI